MELWNVMLLVAAAFLLLCCLLSYFGIGFTINSYSSVFCACRSFLTRGAGKFDDASGCSRRNFVVSKKNAALAVEVETASGTLDVEVKASNGSTLSPASGAYGQDSPVLIDVSRVNRCLVTLRMNHFSGKFHIELRYSK